MRIYDRTDHAYFCGHWNGSPLEIAVPPTRITRVPDTEALHYHDYAEYYVVLEGRAELEVDGRATPLREGTVVMVEAGERHRVTHVDPALGARWVIVKERSEPDSKHLSDGSPRVTPTSLVERLSAVIQAGLLYAENGFDRERYQQLRSITEELLTVLGAGESAIADLLAEGHGYRTPKVDVRCFVLREDRVLLVREREDGRWTLPGGWTDIGQSPAECALRELREESGYEGKVIRLLAVLDRNKQGHDPTPWHIYKLYFHCEVTGEGAGSTLETDGVDFFPVDALPPLSTGRVTAEQIRMLYDKVVSGDREAAFD